MSKEAYSQIEEGLKEALEFIKKENTLSNTVYVVTNELGDFVYGIYDTNEDAVDRSIELGLDGGNYYVEGYTLNADVDPEPDDLAYGN